MGRGTIVPITYNPWLVALSIAVAILVSFTSLRLAARVAEAHGIVSRAWLVLGAISMGAGIWAMHFVGMLALAIPIQLRYDVGLTLASLGTAVVTSGFAIRIASGPQLGVTRHVICSLVMGLGIVGMHYLGMSSIRIVPALSYDPALVAASIAIAVTASYIALGLTFSLRSGTHHHRWMARLGGAVVMGVAIAGMHYTGMAASIIQPGAYCRSGVALNDLWVAISVAVAALGLLTITLVTSIFDAHLAARARLHALRLHQVNERLRHQASHDPLTGLPNRALFIERLRSTTEFPVTEHSAVAVMLVDLDRFKAVNDSLGHSFGDAILKEVAARLRSITGGAGLVARLGGDEFLVLAKVEETRQVARIANQIVRRLAETYAIGPHELYLGASVGVTTYPFDHSEADVLISHADEAMYDIKHAGGNGVRFFVPGTSVFTMARIELERDLRHAVELHQLELHYQPLVDIASGRIRGVEALVRWRHPRLGWIAPADFIPLAESSDLIVDIGRWILGESCRQARAWHLEGLADISVAVNLSARQFRQPDLLATILHAVNANGLQPHHLDLELTESLVMSDADQSIQSLEQLHDAGFQIAVDDFGTGYSSMSYLKRLPVRQLKIDRSFISDLGNDLKSESIVRSVIGLAHGLGMVVIAEGVETTRQLECLHDFECDQYQGYLFSRPRNAADIAELLRRSPVPLAEPAVYQRRLGFIG
jgi:diguanylate cyclase (GGDEF)-like protein